jgi:hypothetical protein
MLTPNWLRVFGNIEAFPSDHDVSQPRLCLLALDAGRWASCIQLAASVVYWGGHDPRAMTTSGPVEVYDCQDGHQGAIRPDSSMGADPRARRSVELSHQVVRGGVFQGTHVEDV